MEIDLSQHVVGKVWLKGHWYKVEYEGLDIIYQECGCYGYLTRDCNKNKVHSKVEHEKWAETSLEKTIN